MLKQYKTKLLNQIFIDFCNNLLTEEEYKDLSLEIEFLFDRMLLGDETIEAFNTEISNEVKECVKEMFKTVDKQRK